MSAVIIDESVTPILTDILRQSRERGFQPPLTLVFVGKDGASAVLRYVPPADGPEQLAQQIKSKQWAMPLNIMIVDSRGEGAVITLRAEQFSKH